MMFLIIISLCPFSVISETTAIRQGPPFYFCEIAYVIGVNQVTCFCAYVMILFLPG